MKREICKRVGISPFVILEFRVLRVALVELFGDGATGWCFLMRWLKKEEEDEEEKGSKVGKRY